MEAREDARGRAGEKIGWGERGVPSDHGWDPGCWVAHGSTEGELIFENLEPV